MEHPTGSASMRVGIIGCGAIAEDHVRALRRMRNVDVVAVCDRSQGVVDHFGDRHKVSSRYTDINALLAAESLNVLHVTTPPRTHAALCARALRHGCHVLVEKPAALTSNELEDVLGLARARNLTLSAVHNGLHQSAFARAHHAIRAGSIGDVRAVHITDAVPSDHEMVVRGDHWSHALPGGVFGELLPHDVYLADALVSDLSLAGLTTHGPGRFPWLPVERIHATMSSQAAVVTIQVSVDSKVWNKTIDITGTAGVVRIDRMCDVVTSLRPAAAWTRRPHFERTAVHLGSWMQQSAHLAAATLTGRPATGHDLLIRDFYSSLATGRVPQVDEERLRHTTNLYERMTHAIDDNAASP